MSLNKDDVINAHGVGVRWRKGNKRMLFNILSVILFWLFSSAALMILFCKIEADPDNSEASIMLGAISTLIFMWVMSWQNWWR